MKVQVENLYTGTVKTVEGTAAAVEAELLRAYPWLNSEDPDDAGSVDDLVDHLNASQSLEAVVVDADTDPMTKAEPSNLGRGRDADVICAMLGHDHNLEQVLQAARWLRGGPETSPEAVRQALWEADGDDVGAALLAYGLEDSEPNRKALASLQTLMEPVVKAEAEDIDLDSVKAATVDGRETAASIKRAAADGFLLPVDLGGKHSAGSLLARDQITGASWLLKPGSGGQSPAAGIKQEAASQSRREASFWHVAAAWGLGDYIPRCDLVLVGGREFAAIKLLPWGYKTLNKIKETDPALPRQLLEPYLRQGLLHRWGALDYILAQTDRNAGNIMVEDSDIQLIDQGSSMAGTDFAPATDNKTFVPYYLRAWAPGRFQALDVTTKLKYLPRLSVEAEPELRAWILGLDERELDRVLGRYQVQAEPARQRLQRLRDLLSSYPADIAVNRAWVDPSK